MRIAKKANIALASAATAWVSALLTLAAPWPSVRVKLTVTTSTFFESHFATGHIDGFVPEFRIFSACVVAAFVGAAAISSASKVAEALFFALQAFATYASLGGTTLVAVLLAAVLTFTSALSDGFYVLMLALVTTLWDAAFATGPQATARALLAVSYVCYSFGIETSRSDETLTTVLTTASCVSATWIQYALLSGLASGASDDSLFLALVLPPAGVLVFLAVNRAESLSPPPPPLPVTMPKTKAHKSSSSKRSSTSLRV